MGSRVLFGATFVMCALAALSHVLTEDMQGAREWIAISWLVMNSMFLASIKETLNEKSR